jgi:general secretion pathway protein G
LRLRMSRTRGFTFIELIVTLAILAVLASLSIPVAQYSVQREKERDLRSALMEIRAAIDAYKKASEQGRINLLPGETGYPHSLSELTDGVIDRRSPQKRKIYFLRKLPADPFSSSQLDPTASWGLRSYDSSADAPAEGQDIYDIYSKSKLVGLNGVPYERW